jgi:hypothetical protein
MRHGNGKREEREAKKRENFLFVLASTANVFRACQIAKLARATAYRWKAADREFASAWEMSEAMGVDVLEAEAIRRAIEGVRRKKFYKGVPIIDPESGEQYFEHEYSDNLLIFMLKARRPDRYGDRSEPQMLGQMQVASMQVITTTATAEEDLAVQAAQSDRTGTGQG